MERFRKILLLAVLAVHLAFAAGAQQIKATARLDSANILLGDQVQLFLEIEHPRQIDVEFPQVPDTILKKIEVLDRSAADTLETENETLRKEIRSYLITCFDSGTYHIPPYWFKLNFDGRTDSVPTNGTTLRVHSMPIDTTRGPTDIKMPYDAPVTLKEVMPIIMGIIFLGALLFLIIYSIKRKKRNKPLISLPKKPKEPAHVIALRELDRIKNEKLWQQGKTKQYYSELTDTLRKFIEERFGIPAREQTSDETLAAFRYRTDLLNEKTFDNLSHILKTADLVKFAKYKPLPDDDNLALVNSYFFVNETKKEEKKLPEKRNSDNEEEGEDVEIK